VADFVVTDDQGKIPAVAEFLMTDDRRVGCVSTVEEARKTEDLWIRRSNSTSVELSFRMCALQPNENPVITASPWKNFTISIYS